MKTTSFAQQANAPQTNSHSPLQATPEQNERLLRRRRFNRLYVYLPMGAIGSLWLLLTLGLIWLTIAGKWFAMDTNEAYYRRLVSGLADAFSILMVVPLLVLCAVPSILAGAVVIYRWQRRREQPDPTPTSPLMWKVENAVASIRDGVESVTAKMSRPVIDLYAAAAFAQSLVTQIKQSILRILQELDRYVNDR